MPEQDKQSDADTTGTTGSDGNVEEKETVQSEEAAVDDITQGGEEIGEAIENAESSDTDSNTIQSGLASKTACAVGMATRIHRMIVRSILPQLHSSLAHKVKNSAHM